VNADEVYVQLMNAGEVYVQLTSNCTESETELLLNVSFEGQGVAESINIAVLDTTNSSSQDLDATTFLDPSSFFAVWSTSFSSCDSPPCDSSSCDSSSSSIRPFPLRLAVITAMFALLVFACPTIGTGRQRSSIGVYSLVIGVLAILLVANAKSENQDQGRRGLETSTCAFNAEVLFHGCDHHLVVNAPSYRVLQVVGLEDQSSSSDVKCGDVDYRATLVFPVSHPLNDENPPH
jgi:hypothetical protein